MYRIPEEFDAVWPWEKQKGESSRAYAAFDHYLTTSDIDRSIRNTAEALGRSYNSVCTLARNHAWRERAEAYDQYEARRRRLIHQREADKMNERQANQAAALSAAAMKSLALYIPSSKNPEPKIMRPRDATRLYNICTKIERVARGEADSIQESKTEVAIKNPDADEKRARMIGLLENPEATEHLAAISRIMGTDGSDEKE